MEEETTTKSMQSWQWKFGRQWSRSWLLSTNQWHYSCRWSRCNGRLQGRVHLPSLWRGCMWFNSHTSSIY
jgi:hypothetical protein